jgi:glycine oxidase
MSHPDVVVLGGGIIGLACARELAGAGMRVELLERQHQGAAASKAAAGLLAPLFEADCPAPLLAACRASRDLWQLWAPELEAETGAGVDYDRSGALQFALDDDDEAALAHAAAAARRLGEPAEEITVGELRRRTPGVAAGVRLAMHFAGEHRVDNIRVCAALTAACQRRGVALRYAVRVFGVRAVKAVTRPAAGAAPLTGTAGTVSTAGTVATVRGQTVRVETDAGRIEAGALVLAAGAWSGQIPGLPALPVRPVRGQMALLGAVGWPWKGSSRRRQVYLVRRGDSDLLVGSTVEEAGFRSQPTVAGIAGLLELARQSYPELGEARLEAAWAGLRPGSADDLPIVGWLPGWPALAATGHFRSGILLAPWTARQVGRLAAGAAAAGGANPTAGDEESLRAFSPERFSARPPA